MRDCRRSVPGAELVYDEEGEGPLLVLVHGTGADASTWSALMKECSASYRVVAYDRRGYGRSTHPPVRDHRLHTADLAALLEHLGPTAHVVGWSSGGVIGLDLAIHHPRQVASLTVMEAPLHGLRHPSPGMFKALALAKLAQLRGRHQDGARAFFRWASGTRDGGNAFDRATEDDRSRLLHHSRAVLAELDPGFYGPLGEHVSYEDMARIEAPMTWVVGGASMPWYWQLAERAKRAVPAIDLVQLDGTSHLMHTEAPRALAAVIGRAIERSSARPREKVEAAIS